MSTKTFNVCWNCELFGFCPRAWIGRICEEFRFNDFETLKANALNGQKKTGDKRMIRFNPCWECKKFRTCPEARFAHICRLIEHGTWEDKVANSKLGEKENDQVRNTALSDVRQTDAKTE